jgi:SAM-dependent methyltransferase
MTTLRQDPALSAYEALAPFYDRYTADYDHARWLREIRRVGTTLGLRGNRLLDVGCGTGRSFLPMLERGWSVTACDISPAMCELALRAAGGRAEVVVADARELPELGEFDLVTCLDDALNYLLDDDELLAAFEGFERNLRPGGMLVFDLNSLATFRGFFSRDAAFEDEETFFCWRGQSDPDAEPGAVASAVVEVFAHVPGGDWNRTSSRHVQRHHPPELVRELLERAGLELLALRGQVTGDRIEAVASEERQAKLLYFARRPDVTEPTAEGGE